MLQFPKRGDLPLRSPASRSLAENRPFGECRGRFSEDVFKITVKG